MEPMLNLGQFNGFAAHMDSTIQMLNDIWNGLLNDIENTKRRFTLGARPGVPTWYTVGTLQGHGQSTGPNPGGFIFVTLEIPLTCVPKVYQLGFSQGHPQCSHGLLHIFCFRCIPSVPTVKDSWWGVTNISQHTAGLYYNPLETK